MRMSVITMTRGTHQSWPGTVKRRAKSQKRDNRLSRRFDDEEESGTREISALISVEIRHTSRGRKKAEKNEKVNGNGIERMLRRLYNYSSRNLVRFLV